MTSRRLWIQWPSNMTARGVRLWDAATDQEIGYRVLSMQLHVDPNADNSITATLTYIADEHGEPLALDAKVVENYETATSEWIVTVMNFEAPAIPQKPERPE